MTAKKDSFDLSEARHLLLPNQLFHNDRYLARPYPAFGVCVYTLRSVGMSNIPEGAWHWQCQCFPTSGGLDTNMSEDYIAYILMMAGSSVSREQEKILRATYRFFAAPDLLTLKCLIDEAAENWKVARLCLTTNSQP